MRYSTFDLHTKQKSILDAADQGEEVIVYRRGRDYKLVHVGPSNLITSVSPNFETDIHDL